MNFSLAEEDYIKAIYHLSAGMEGVSTNAIADRLQTKPASVSDMVQKLANKKVVNYVKYKGVTLTDTGNKIALGIIRKHRLWEVFLVQKLKFDWDKVHEVAEQLEHVQSALLIERLDEFLGYPKNDPHGDPIPDQHGALPAGRRIPLAELEPGTTGTVVGVNDTSEAFLQYLTKMGIELGTLLTILDKIEYDGSLEVRINEKNNILVSREVSRNILVK